jgi:hypothetical protein
MSRNLLLVLFVLLLAGGGAAVWFSGGGGVADLDLAVPQTPTGRTRTDLEGGQAPDRVALEGPVQQSASMERTTVVLPLRVELVQISRGIFKGSSLPPPGSDANARLKGLLRGERGAGLTGRVLFTHGPNGGRELRTDTLGRFGASDLYQGLSIVRVETDTGLTAVREIELRQLSESQLNLDLSQRASAYVRGRVRDVRGEPIFGAEVRMDGGTSMTNDLGEFEFARICPGKVPVVVKKHGYAHVYQVLGVVRGRPTAYDQLTFSMHPGADLEVRLDKAVGSPGPATLFILPVGGRSVSTKLGSRTFPWHEVNPVEVYPGGSVLIEGLQEGHVSLLAFHPGALASPPIVNKNLVPGQKNQHVISLRAAPVTIRGTVKGPDGLPAQGARVRLEDPTRSFATTKAMQKRKPVHQLGMVVPHLPAALQETVTDRGGRFILTAFPAVSPKGYYLTVESADGQARVNRVVPAETADLDLELKTIAQIGGSLNLYMGGRFQGLPVDIQINGQPQETRLLPADEELIIEDLDPGRWRLEVWWNQDHIKQGFQFEVAPRKEKRLPLVLPLGAIEGQSQEEATRAGR